MGRVVHGIEKHLRADSMRAPRDLGHIDDASRGVGRHGAGHHPRLLGEHRLQIGRVQAPVVAHSPPPDPGAQPLEREPRRDVGLVVQIGDDDLGPIAQVLANGKTDGADERRGVQPERNFVRMPGIDERGHARAGSIDHRVHLARVAVRAAALHSALDEVVGHRLDDPQGHLRAGRVVEEEKEIVALERGKLAPERLDWERCHKDGILNSRGDAENAEWKGDWLGTFMTP